MLRLVYLFVITAAIRRDTSFSLVQEKDGGSKTTCQYTVERGRPEPRDGTFRRTHWKKVVTYYKDQDFLQCRARCDALPTCVAFIRRASDDVGYLGMSMKSLRAADDDPTKLLEVPNDVVLGDCWLLETGKLAKYKLIQKITSRITAKGKYDHPFRTLHYEQKNLFYQSLKDEKVTFAKRDCSCEYRYLGVVPSPSQSDQSDEYKVLKKCEGEYRYIRREYVKVGFEAVYQRTDGETFIYLCPNATKNADGILTREWYCFDKDDPVFLKEKAKKAGKSMKGIKSFLLGGPLIEDLETCLGQRLPRQGAALPPLDLPLGPEDKDGEPTALTYPRMKPMVLGTAAEGASYEVESLKIGTSQGFFSCAAGKKESEDIKKDFFLKTSQCMLSVNSSRLAWVQWMNKKGSTQHAIVRMLAGSMRGYFSLFTHHDRSYISIIWRALALWEKLEKAIALVNYIQDGESSSGHPMEQGEKYACAELMVDEIKSAGGIMPKVSQTLAMKPDVVKDDFVRSALKSTQTENPAKSLEYVRQYVVEKLKAAVENEERTNDGDIISSIDEHLTLNSTLATGSVAQVLRAWVKPDASSRVRDLCDKGQPTCAVVLKVVFDENEKNYEDDWEAIQFLGNDLLKMIHEKLEGGGLAQSSMAWIFKLNETQMEEIRHAVSAGYDTWQAVRQGLGAVMDEFDLRVEDLNAKAGRAAVKTFDADVKLKKELGVDGITFDVPKVLMTKSRYIMLQSFAKGDTLTSYHASISGQSGKLKDWRRNIYPSIMGLYGYLMVERGFFQGDPHPGNWYWEDESKTLTLIDWGLADDFSGGLARAGKLYLDATGKPPKKGTKVYTQEDIDQTISEHKCQMANFYKMMADYRRKELLCQGFTVKDSAKNGLGDMVLVPSPAATIILDGTEHQLHTKFFARNLSLGKAVIGDSFFATPSFGVGDKKPFVLQRRRSPTCFMKDGEEVCGHGWEFSQIDGEGEKTYVPLKTCVSESCVKTSYAADDVDEEACKKTCKTVDCIKHCEKFTSPPPAKLDSLEIRPVSLKSCRPLPFREQAYADGAASLGFSTENMNPVVLSLFAALFTNDLLDLKARQENIKLNDPKEPGTSLPDYSAVMLRSLAVFLGMIQDMVQENKPPFVSVMITEYMTDTAPDEMFLYWRIFAKRFLRDNKNQCSVTDTAW